MGSFPPQGVTSHDERHEPGGVDEVNDVDILNTGVNVSAHQSRHVPGAADPIPTGVPSDVGVANAEGVAVALARQDHEHNHPAGLGVDLHHDEDHGTGEHDATVSKKRVCWFVPAHYIFVTDVAWTDEYLCRFLFDKSLYDHLVSIKLGVTMGSANTLSVRLYDQTTGAPVANSLVQTIGGTVTMKSADFQADLPASEVELRLQRMVDVGNGEIGIVWIEIIQSE